jgi:hypothetical protein
VKPLELAERVARIGRAVNVDTALIGGIALAVHGYERGTDDIDLASVVDPYVDLVRFRDALAQEGLRTQLTHPDEEDPLGGVLRVWINEDEDGEPIEPVEVVNLNNPHRALRLPGRELLRQAIELPEVPDLRCVSLPHLIVLKLYAGSLPDLADAASVLAKNPDADLEEIRAVCKRYRLHTVDALVEAELDRRKRG